jgi:CheY-like chemotaxis protein
MSQALDFGVWCYEPSKPPSGFLNDLKGDLLEKENAPRLKILVVDDELTIADTLVEILNGEGFETIAASTGDSALTSAQAFGPDIVISDVVMPGLNGVELGIKIRQALPKCRVILFSGQTATSDLLREARKRGHEFEIVAKPVKPQTLIAMIRNRSN